MGLKYSRVHSAAEDDLKPLIFLLGSLRAGITALAWNYAAHMAFGPKILLT